MLRNSIIAVVFLISGCASKPLYVTYVSDPPGAVLYEDATGTRFGYTPVTLNYQVSDDEREQGYKRLSGTTVKWISGASANYKYIDADINRFGYNQTVTFKRPDDAPGREADERFAFDLGNQRNQAEMQRQQNKPAPYQLPAPYQIPIESIYPKTTTSTCGWVGNQWICRTR